MYCFEDHYKGDQHANNVQCKNWIKKICDEQKANLIFLCHIKMKCYFFWHVTIFLLLCDNENISLWYNILNNVQNKNLVLHEKQFWVEKKAWCCRKSNLVSTNASWCCSKMYFMLQKKSWSCTKKVFLVDKSKMMLHKKKNLFSKMLLIFNGKAPYLSAKCFSNFNIV